MREDFVGKGEHKSIPALAMAVHHGKRFAHDLAAIFQTMPFRNRSDNKIGKAPV
jgi:hypothetical protein